MNMTTWAENEVRLACKREAPDRKDGEWDYGCACYESALKAYKSLMEDGHSGMSFGFTKGILERLMNNLPLTPIEDTEDMWNDIRTQGDNFVEYQCKRRSSLFKRVYSDGTIEYNDIDRCYCVDIHKPNGSWTYGLINKIVHEMFPIKMPYWPQKAMKVYCEKFLTDPVNGDFDTVGIFYILKPDGSKFEVNRYFKDSPDPSGLYPWLEEIDIVEYYERKAKEINAE